MELMVPAGLRSSHSCSVVTVLVVQLAQQLLVCDFGLIGNLKILNKSYLIKDLRTWNCKIFAVPSDALMAEAEDA